MAAQLGKPITIQEDPSLLSHMDFLKLSRYALPYDIYGNAYTALLRVVSGFREVWAHTRSEDPSGASVDIGALALQTDTEILHGQRDALEGFDSSGDAGGWFLQTVLRTQPQTISIIPVTRHAFPSGFTAL